MTVLNVQQENNSLAKPTWNVQNIHHNEAEGYVQNDI